MLTFNHKFNIQKTLLKILKQLWQSDIQESDELSVTFTNLFPKIIYKKGTTIANKLINVRGDSNNLKILDPLDKQNIQILTELLQSNSNS